MAHNGILVVIIEAFPGEVRLTPKIKHPWLNTMASKEATNKLAMSL